MKELRIRAETQNLDTVLAFVNQTLEEAGFDESQILKVDLAVEEIFCNIANYAYQPEQGDVWIRCAVSGENPDQVEIVFMDAGIPYNPMDRAEPDLTLGAEERSIGGLGVYLARKMMDSMKYRHEAGRNILTVTKRLMCLAGLLGMLLFWSGNPFLSYGSGGILGQDIPSVAAQTVDTTARATAAAAALDLATPSTAARTEGRPSGSMDAAATAAAAPDVATPSTAARTEGRPSGFPDVATISTPSAALPGVATPSGPDPQKWEMPLEDDRAPEGGKEELLDWLYGDGWEEGDRFTLTEDITWGAGPYLSIDREAVIDFNGHSILVNQGFQMGGPFILQGNGGSPMFVLEKGAGLSMGIGTRIQAVDTDILQVACDASRDWKKGNQGAGLDMGFVEMSVSGKGAAAIRGAGDLDLELLNLSVSDGAVGMAAEGTVTLFLSRVEGTGDSASIQAGRGLVLDTSWVTPEPEAARTEAFTRSAQVTGILAAPMFVEKDLDEGELGSRTDILMTCPGKDTRRLVWDIWWDLSQVRLGEPGTYEAKAVFQEFPMEIPDLVLPETRVQLTVMDPDLVYLTSIRPNKDSYLISLKGNVEMRAETRLFYSRDQGANWETWPLTREWGPHPMMEGKMEKEVLYSFQARVTSGDQVWYTNILNVQEHVDGSVTESSLGGARDDSVRDEEIPGQEEKPGDKPPVERPGGGDEEQPGRPGGGKDPGRPDPPPSEGGSGDGSSGSGSGSGSGSSGSGSGSDSGSSGPGSGSGSGSSGPGSGSGSGSPGSGNSSGGGSSGPGDGSGSGSPGSGDGSGSESSGPGSGSDGMGPGSTSAGVEGDSGNTHPDPGKGAEGSRSGLLTSGLEDSLPSPSARLPLDSPGIQTESPETGFSGSPSGTPVPGSSGSPSGAPVPGSSGSPSGTVSPGSSDSREDASGKTAGDSGKSLRGSGEQGNDSSASKAVAASVYPEPVPSAGAKLFMTAFMVFCGVAAGAIYGLLHRRGD